MTTKESLRQRQDKLINLVSAIDRLVNSESWSYVKTEVFDKEAERLTRLLLAEAMKNPLNVQELYRLQGQLDWIRAHDVVKLGQRFTLELENIKKQL